MTVLQVSAFSATSTVQCAILAEVVKLIASVSVACLDVGGARQVVSSVPCHGFSDAVAESVAGSVLDQCDGVIEMIERGTPSAVDLSALAQFADRDNTGLTLEDWRVFTCRCSDGTVDLIALLSRETDAAIKDFLQKFWPGVRRMCVTAVQTSVSHVSDDAMLWMVSRKMNASILVLDSQGHVLKTNAAGREMLARKDVLHVTQRGLLASNAQETRALRLAIGKLLHDAAEQGDHDRESDGEDHQKRTEYVLFLSKPGRDERVPMTLSLYRPESGGDPLILAMLPQPPDHKRIEELARQMGLTPSEARVAALVRSGLSNREAAERAGLKVETFNTYVKRVLSKMNVSCRAEMAQMLTWQASMERSL